MSKDWIGNKASTFVTLAASNHSKGEREENDYYATEPKAVELLLAEERFSETILEPACVDSETEYFNGVEWKKIVDYIEGDKVLSYKNDGYSELVLPLKYIKKRYDGLFYYWDSRYLNMKLTPNHRIIYYKVTDGSLAEKSAKDLFADCSGDSNGFRGKIPTVWQDDGFLQLDEWELRLAVACNADGRMRSKYKKTCLIRVKKVRKKDRLLWLLHKANIDYDFYIKDDYFYIKYENPLNCKVFPKEWVNLSKNSKMVFLDELKFWDGTVDKDGCVSYFSAKKEDVDLVQYIAHSIGIHASIHVDTRKANISYRVIFHRQTTKYALSFRRGIKHLQLESSADGFCYCFTVPSSMLILRRNNKIFITGNCGEGHIAEVLKKNGYKVECYDVIDRGYGKVKDFFTIKDKLNMDIITNPPYKYSSIFVEHALELVEDGHKVAMFLKLQFLEGKARKKLFAQYPPKYVYVSSSRLNCAKNGKFEEFTSSAVAYAWFVWVKGFKGEPTIRWIN